VSAVLSNDFFRQLLLAEHGIYRSPLSIDRLVLGRTASQGLPLCLLFLIVDLLRVDLLYL